jgi:arabinogalactan endo-1,4-beta-galactosidase
MKMHIRALLICLLITINLAAQDFYFGQDLSYVNQMEDCGAQFKENGTARDVYNIFADHGTNLVRARLWVDPSWWQDSLIQPEGVKPRYNDLEDVKETLSRARSAGMSTMLGIHYSDFWADPGRQLIPRAWLDVAYQTEALRDSVYNYTVRILTELDREGLMPDFVKVGNENNGGILRHIPEENGWDPVESVSNDWSRHAVLYNAAIEAIRQVGATSSTNPEIVIHFSNSLSGQVWNYRNIINHGVTDFDVIGISYYYAWHGGSIGELENTIRTLVSTFPGYRVMVAETGYLWTTENFDELGNIITEPDPEYLPVIPEKQLEYMVDYTRAVLRAGGIGVVFWEPAWVSTPCTTPWGTGSSHDHVAFFDPVNTNFMENGGGRWTDPGFYTDLESKKITFKVNMKGQETTGGVYIAAGWSGDSLHILPMASEGQGIYSWFTYLSAGTTGTFYFLNDSTLEAAETVPEACRGQDSQGRAFEVGEQDQIISFTWGTCDPAEPPSQVQVTFQVKMDEDADLSRGVYVVGEMNDWEITRMEPLGELIYSKSFMLPPGGDSLGYYYLTTATWQDYRDYRETVPEACALKWGSDRVIVVPSTDTTVGHLWGSCSTIGEGPGVHVMPLSENEITIYPNPVAGQFSVQWPGSAPMVEFHFFEITGKEIKLPVLYSTGQTYVFHTESLPDGIYILRLTSNTQTFSRRVIIARG